MLKTCHVAKLQNNPKYDRERDNENEIEIEIELKTGFRFMVRAWGRRWVI